MYNLTRFIPESVRWLTSKGKDIEAERILEKVNFWNNNPPRKYHFNAYKDQSSKLNISTIFGYKEFLKLFAFSTFMW